MTAVDRLGDLMLPEELAAVLPLHELVVDREVAHLEVHSDRLALASKLTHTGSDLLDHELDRGDIGEAHRRDRRQRQWLDLVLEQVIDLGLVQLVETTNSFLACLVEGHLPIHLVQILVVNDYENWANAKFHRSDALRVGETLVERVPALIRLKDWAEDGEILYLNGLLLLLDHVPDALSDATPDHVEEAESLALRDFELVLPS